MQKNDERNDKYNKMAVRSRKQEEIRYQISHNTSSHPSHNSLLCDLLFGKWNTRKSGTAES